MKKGNFPAVSYIKSPAVGDAHPGNSDPLDEQAYLVQLVNFIESQPDWKDTAIIITYDDSDGWYDHRYAAPTTASSDPTADQLNGAGICTSTKATPGKGVDGETVNGRCGPGTRIPLLVLSPYARSNYVSGTRLTQSSVVRFIEDNWLGGERLGDGSNDAKAGSLMDMFDFNRGRFSATRPLFLDPDTGTEISCESRPTVTARGATVTTTGRGRGGSEFPRSASGTRQVHTPARELVDLHHTFRRASRQNVRNLGHLEPLWLSDLPPFPSAAVSVPFTGRALGWMLACAPSPAAGWGVLDDARPGYDACFRAGCNRPRRQPASGRTTCAPGSPAERGGEPRATDVFRPDAVGVGSAVLCLVS